MAAGANTEEGKKAKEKLEKAAAEYRSRCDRMAAPPTIVQRGSTITIKGVR